MCILAACVFLGVLLLFTPYHCFECPFGCECFAVTHTVKCVSKDLLTVPQNIPRFIRNVVITGNNIYQIGPHSFTELQNVTNLILSNNSITELASRTFAALTNLHSLDLSGNQLAQIHPEALSIPGSPLRELNLSRSLHNFTALMDLTTTLRWGGLWGLLRLDLSGNLLALLPPGMLSHVPNLQQLLLRNNSLMSVYAGTFSGLNRLEVLDLTHNEIEAFRPDTLQELERLGNAQIFLGNNPYTCSCESLDFVTWLNKTKARVDKDVVRCASPEELANTQLQGLSVQAIGCVVPVLTEVTDLTLQTSYVFLGLVLGFVGMVFLFVLYLNRNGVTKWIIEARDACRDVLEAYHYRYEIDSDPRLGQITASSSTPQRHLGQVVSQELPNNTCIVQNTTEMQVKHVATSPPLKS